MKKLFITFIVITFLFNVFGYYLPFYLIRSAHRSEIEIEIRDNLNKENLVEVTYSLSNHAIQPNWIIEGKEFRYNDEMYDVVSIIMHKDSITYLCVCDSQEQNLISNFNDLVNKNLENNKKSKLETSKKLSKYNILNNVLNTHQNNLMEWSDSIPFFYKSLNKKIDYPPPESAYVQSKIVSSESKV